MKQEQIKEIITDLSNQLLGEDYLDSIESYKLVDIGRGVLDTQTSTEKFLGKLVDRLGKIVIMERKYVGSMPWLYVDSMLWGGFIERVYFDFADLIDDPSIAPVVGTDYSAIEHKFYGTKAMVKLFGKQDGYMLPVSISKTALHSAFKSEEEMNSFINGLELNIQNQLAVAYEVFRKAIVTSGIAVAVKNTENVRHMLTEYNTEMDKNLTSTQAKNDEDFLTWLAQQIATDRDNMTQMSKVYNNGECPTFTPRENSRLLLLSQIDKAIKFRVKADTFHADMIGIEGTYEPVSAWQGVADSTSEFDYAVVSTIKIAEDDDNTLGIGTNAVTIENVIGFMFDDKALGFTYVHENDTTSSWTASAKFWNYFHHRSAYGIVDPQCNMLAYLLD